MFTKKNFNDKIPVIVVDEFDRLSNPATLEQVSDLLKQLSVISADLKFCFCGVTDDLGELLSSHQSVDRYVFGVELRPFPSDVIWRLVEETCKAFGIDLGRGRMIRISQIAAGYPHFAHLIVKNTLLEAYERGWKFDEISDEIFREGLNRSSSQAATRLRTTYEDAIRKGTDRYMEVLFATANSVHMNRQFKDIVSDYEIIMERRPERQGYDTRKANAQDLRNALDNLSRRGFLKKGASGWYQFHDPMLRSYIRLIAETEGVELSDDAFPA